MSRIFLSYSRRDGAYANQLHKLLDRLQVHGFLDQADIAAGARFDEYIRDAIRDSDAVVVLLSENSVQSNWVMAEVGAAWTLDKRIIPVIPPGASIRIEELPAFFQDVEILDARQQPLAETAEKIADVVQHPED